MDCLQADSKIAANLEKLVSQGLSKSEGARGPVDHCSARTLLAKNIIRNKPQSSPLLIIINDVDSINTGRDSFPLFVE